jgi:hypothetical protein
MGGAIGSAPSHEAPARLSAVPAGSAKLRAGNHALSQPASTIRLRPSQLFVARAKLWTTAADGGAPHDMPLPPNKKKKLRGGEGRVGFSVPAARGKSSPKEDVKEGPKAGFVFVPALHVGADGIGSALRVSFARALLPEPDRGLPDPRDVPVRPPEGSEVIAAGAAGGRALVGLPWPGLGGRRLASRRRVAAWALSLFALVGGFLGLVDLACVAEVVDEEAGWNQATTRAFMLSLVFSLAVGDLIKVVAITFISGSLLPGYLSPRAHVLRFLFRGLAKVLDAFL